ncbi:MAG: transaldolase [Hahellaceae bacterium]|nr:transaldolase [Hahellaceae bacterium]
MENKLEQLRKMTTVVADTGDIEAIRQWNPQDATTNPSLLLKAASLSNYAPLLQSAIAQAEKINGSSDEQVAHATDLLAVSIGKEIINIIPGRVSTEVDARLSFDTEATLAKARKLIELYDQQCIAKDRVLIKIASTWEGIKAAEILEKEGIQCNLTLLFGFAQAVAAAQAGAYLISPFVGRILDWYVQNTAQANYLPHEDPGVVSVTRIYEYFKSNDYSTIVMGASFRNIGEIEVLAGCDRLTISPQLLNELSLDSGHLPRQLSPSNKGVPTPINLPEQTFRWQMNENAMATDKLAEGIRKFAEDQIKLENLLKSLGK